MIKKTKYFIASLAVFTLPFLNLFAFGTFTNFTLLFCVLYLILKLLDSKKVSIPSTSIYLYIIIILSFLSVFFTLFGGNILFSFYKNIRMYILIFVFLISIYNILLDYGLIKISKWLYYGLLLVFIFGLTDFVLSNFFEVHLDNYLFRYAIKTNPGTIGPLYRIRSTMGEPGDLAYYINSIFPLSLIYAWPKRKYIYILLGLLTFILTFSAAGLVAALFSFIYLFILKRFNKKKLLLIVLIAIIILFLHVQLVDNIYYQLTVGKVLLNSNNSSVQDRMQNLEKGFEYFSISLTDIKKLFFGFGPGYFEDNSETAIHNYHFTLLLENGIISLMVWLLFLFFQYRKTCIKKDYRFFLLQYSLFSSLIHLFIINSIYLYFIWIVFIYIDYLSKGENNENPPRKYYYSNI